MRMTRDEKIEICKKIRDLAETGRIKTIISNTKFEQLLDFFSIDTDLAISQYFTSYFQHIQPFMILDNSNDNQYSAYIADIYEVVFSIDNQHHRIMIKSVNTENTRQEKYHFNEIDIIKDNTTYVDNTYVEFLLSKGFTTIPVKIKYKYLLSDGVYVVAFDNIKTFLMEYASKHINPFLRTELERNISEVIKKLIHRLLSSSDSIKNIEKDAVLSILLEFGSPNNKDMLNLSSIDNLVFGSTLYLERIHLFTTFNNLQ